MVLVTRLYSGLRYWWRYFIWLSQQTSSLCITCLVPLNNNSCWVVVPSNLYFIFLKVLYHRGTHFLKIWNLSSQKDTKKYLVVCVASSPFNFQATVKSAIIVQFLRMSKFTKWWQYILWSSCKVSLSLLSDKWCHESFLLQCGMNFIGVVPTMATCGKVYTVWYRIQMSVYSWPFLGRMIGEVAVLKCVLVCTVYCQERFWRDLTMLHVRLCKFYSWLLADGWKVGIEWRSSPQL